MEVQIKELEEVEKKMSTAGKAFVVGAQLGPLCEVFSECVRSSKQTSELLLKVSHTSTMQ